MSNKPKVTIPTISVPDETNEITTKPPPMMTTVPINGVPAKSLIDTGSSDDFIGTHFVTTNCHETAVAAGGRHRLASQVTSSTMYLKDSYSLIGNQVVSSRHYFTIMADIYEWLKSVNQPSYAPTSPPILHLIFPLSHQRMRISYFSGSHSSILNGTVIHTSTIPGIHRAFYGPRQCHHI